IGENPMGAPFEVNWSLSGAPYNVPSFQLTSSAHMIPSMELSRVADGPFAGYYAVSQTDGVGTKYGYIDAGETADLADFLDGHKMLQEIWTESWSTIPLVNPGTGEVITHPLP